MQSFRKPTAGFTFIELMLAVGLVAVLLAIALPSDDVTHVQVSNSRSLDDVIRANNGAFLGVAADF